MQSVAYIFLDVLIASCVRMKSVCSEWPVAVCWRSMTSRSETEQVDVRGSGTLLSLS